MAACFCNRIMNIVFSCAQQWMATFLPILCFCRSLFIFIYSKFFSKTVSKFPPAETPTKTNFIISSVQVCMLLYLLTKQFSDFPTAVISENIWNICSCGWNGFLTAVFSSCLQTSLASLMTTLSQSHPYFVRCVKPNEKKVWNKHRQVIHQVLRAVSSPGAVVFLRRRAGNKERGAWWLGCVPGGTHAHNTTGTALQPNSDALGEGSFQSTCTEWLHVHWSLEWIHVNEQFLWTPLHPLLKVS